LLYHLSYGTGRGRQRYVKLDVFFDSFRQKCEVMVGALKRERQWAI
jgi:hypothetical protein